MALINYKFIQIGVFFSFLTLGIIRIFDDNFPFNIFFSTISLFLALIALLHTVTNKIDKLYIVPNRKGYLIKKITIIMLSFIFAILIVGLMAYFKIIPSPIGDGFSIIALGISLSNEWLSSVVVNIIESKKHKNIKIKNDFTA